MANIDLTKNYDYEYYPEGDYCNWRIYCIETGETLCFAESVFECKDELLHIALDKREAHMD